MTDEALEQCLGADWPSTSSKPSTANSGVAVSDDMQSHVEAKAARIKEWALGRFKELEHQNEKLRLQNAKCIRQLQALKTCADNNETMWRSSIVSGAGDEEPTSELPIMLTRSAAHAASPSSDDSGTASDVPSPCVDPIFSESTHLPLEWPVIREQQRTVLMQRALSASTHSHTQYQMSPQHFFPSSAPPRRRAEQRLSRSLNGSLERGHANGEVMLRAYAVTGVARVPHSQMDDGHTLYAQPYRRPPYEPEYSTIQRDSLMLSPRGMHSLPRRKPVPTPRRRNTRTVERDSLETDEHEQYLTVSMMKSHQFGDSMCNYATDMATADYVNLDLLKNSINRNTTSINRNTHTLERSMPPWERELYDLARTCLDTSLSHDRRNDSQQADKIRTSLAQCSPVAKPTGYQTLNRPKQFPEPSNSPVIVPVYSTCHGKLAQLRKLRPTHTSEDAMDSGSTSGASNSASRAYTSGASSNDRVSGGSSSAGKKTSSGHSMRMPEETIPESLSSISATSSGLCGSSRSSAEGGHADAQPQMISSLMNSSLHCVLLENGQCAEEIQAAMESDTGRKITEKQGYLNRVGDRMKSLKRRWAVLETGTLTFFKSPNEASKKKVLSTINMADIVSVERIRDKGQFVGFQICTQKDEYRLTSESSDENEDWIKCLNRCMNISTAGKLHSCAALSRGAARGWVNKVKHGHAKKCWCVVMQQTLAFFKHPGEKIPFSQISLKGATVEEVNQSSDDSSSDNEATSPTSHVAGPGHHSIAVHSGRHEPTYLVFSVREEMDKWLYLLNVASSASGPGVTSFERLVQQMMENNRTMTSDLWADGRLSRLQATLDEPLTTLSSDALKKGALQLYRECHLFGSVAIQPTAIDYHVDLAQTILAHAQNEPGLQNELYCQLIKLTSTPDLPTLQAWHLLALALSLFTPSQYCVMWLLRRYLERSSAATTESGQYATFCQHMLERCLQNRPRQHRISRLEATSLLSHKPYQHSTPFSIPVHLPNDSYQLVGFDGCSTAAECLENICKQTNLPCTPESGWVLCYDDPNIPDVEHSFHPRTKVCDVMSQWEQKLMENRAGKFPSNRIIRIRLEKRFHFRHHTENETDSERIMLTHHIQQQLVDGSIALPADLLPHLIALYAQINYGDFSSASFHRLLSQHVPAELKNENGETQARDAICQRWQALKSSSPEQCSFVYLTALRKWPLFGSTLFQCIMRRRAEENVWLAVNEFGVELLSADTQQRQIQYPYEHILSFGGCRDDFMLVTSRPGAAEGEPPKERLIFAMKKVKVLQVTNLIADYIRMRKRVVPRRAA